jgi:hypothetical protein
VITTPKDEASRRCWFEWYVDQLESNSTVSSKTTEPFRCPCCHCRALDERGSYDICPICFLEDDGQGGPNVKVARGDPNGVRGLAKVRLNYLQFNACKDGIRQLVRSPTFSPYDSRMLDS